MKLRSLQRATVFVVAASFALAQERTGSSVERSRGDENAAVNVSNPVENANIPDSEKVRISSQSIGQMRVSLRDALGKLEEARSTKDVVKLNCVNEKLTRIKGLLRISEQSDVQLQESVAKKETDSSKQEFIKISIAGQKVEQLHAEIEQCIGQLAFRTDENLSVELELPEYLPRGEPSRLVPWMPADFRPPPASYTR